MSCKRLGRYRMPLAWTAIDLTPFLIELENRNLTSKHSFMPEPKMNNHLSECKPQFCFLSVYKVIIKIYLKINFLYKVNQKNFNFF